MIFACVVAAIVLAVLGAAVLLHPHMDDSPYTSLAKTEGCPFYCCYFQPADVRNHACRLDERAHSPYRRLKRLARIST